GLGLHAPLRPGNVPRPGSGRHLQQVQREGRRIHRGTAGGERVHPGADRLSDPPRRPYPDVLVLPADVPVHRNALLSAAAARDDPRRLRRRAQGSPRAGPALRRLPRLSRAERRSAGGQLTDDDRLEARMSRETEEEKFYNAVEETSRMMGVPFDRDKVRPLLTGYRGAFAEGNGIVFSVHADERHAGELNYAITVPPEIEDPYAHAVSHG